MKQARTLIISAVIAIFGAAVLIPATPALAVVNPLAICDTDAGSDNEICKEENRNDNASELIGIVVNTLLFIVGLLAVVMIIFSGIQYTTSSGDSGRVSKAKNTLVYSIVGLIVAFLAYALVNWVFQLF